eukprot:CAMPEP_0181168462 /NCGR_PEP_ID=MMETSP1096-20121128/286_1 /TAXON_ID=156174 ORGANISM="Chrysochromulina ericina, Strain CCMP281" /NCGR_SAMPLE_ID=MMETSP1096 /ASSEMBLY_ACC=CAM_ASM_000453 /LENGTH=203 /DNA_ID=CAMNT_0023255839 /DNA_START=474 /DNA_END=1087 /DNA_ORIENTATION=+
MLQRWTRCAVPGAAASCQMPRVGLGNGLEHAAVHVQSSEGCTRPSGGLVGPRGKAGQSGKASTSQRGLLPCAAAARGPQWTHLEHSHAFRPRPSRSSGQRSALWPQALAHTLSREEHPSHLTDESGATHIAPEKPLPDALSCDIVTRCDGLERQAFLPQIFHLEVTCLGMQGSAALSAAASVAAAADWSPIVSEATRLGTCGL